MNKPDFPPTVPPAANAAKPAPTSAKPAKAKRSKTVEYAVKLSEAEARQLSLIRNNCRSAGIRVTKGTLLRAALSLLNQQSSSNIEAQLQALQKLKRKK